VTLQKRVSKNVYDLEKVRLVPIPALQIATAAEARHYAATYAMFRVSVKAYLQAKARLHSKLTPVLLAPAHGDDAAPLHPALLVDSHR
jgi:hypothetical protein